MKVVQSMGVVKSMYKGRCTMTMRCSPQGSCLTQLDAPVTEDEDWVLKVLSYHLLVSVFLPALSCICDLLRCMSIPLWLIPIRRLIFFS